MNFNRGAVLRVIALIGGLIYFGIVVWLGIVTATKSTAAVPTVLLPLVTAIGTALSLNFGAVLGLPAQPTDKGSLVTAAARTLDYKPADDIVKLSIVQLVGMGIYGLSLVIATVCWLIAGFSTTSPQAIQSLGASLIGVVAGVVTIALQKSAPAQDFLAVEKSTQWQAF